MEVLTAPSSSKFLAVTPVPRTARLQVDIARLNYLVPWLRETAEGDKERQMGQAGETSMELDRRNVRDQIAALKRELAYKMKWRLDAQGAQSFSQLPVGYTNAGKFDDACNDRNRSGGWR